IVTICWGTTRPSAVPVWCTTSSIVTICWGTTRPSADAVRRDAGGGGTTVESPTAAARYATSAWETWTARVLAASASACHSSVAGTSTDTRVRRGVLGVHRHDVGAMISPVCGVLNGGDHSQRACVTPSRRVNVGAGGIHATRLGTMPTVRVSAG